MKRIMLKMKMNRAITIAAVLLFVAGPSPFAVLHAADEKPPRPDADNGQIRKLITEERWNEALKLAPFAARVPGQRNTAEELIQTNLPILIDWDVCAPKSTVQDPEMQRPGIYRYPWVEFYPSPAGADPEGLWAALHLQYSSWPKTAWKVTLQRLDRAGAAVLFHRTFETVQENSGTIEGIPALEDAIVKWQVGDHREVTADPGRIFWISMEALWTEQGNPVRWNDEMPLSLDLGSIEYSKVFRAQGLKLEEIDGDMRATVQARILSWPKSQWRLSLALFDRNGSPVGRGTTTAENTGEIISRPGVRQESLRFNIAGAREAKEAAQRYTLRIERVGASHERQTGSLHPGSITNAASPFRLAGLISDTLWEWGDGSERIQFGKDGWIDHHGWNQRGLVTSWEVIDEHTVLLTIEEGRSVDRYAILVFNTDFTEYTTYSFHGGQTLMPCKRIQRSTRSTGSDGAANGSQPDRSEPSYPWVVFGRVTDSKGSGMSGVNVSASCGRGSLMPSGATSTDTQGNYRLAFGPGRVWKEKSGRVDMAKTIEGTGFQAAIIGAGKTGYYEKDLGRQGDLRMARDLPRPDQHPDIAAERIVLPNQPRRVDFVMLPAASISGRVVDANGKPAEGRRFYVVSDKLPPAATVFCEFRPDATGSFKIGGLPCQSYWLEPADGSLAGLRSNPLAIPKAGNYAVEVSINEADKTLKARIITAPAPPTGD